MTGKVFQAERILQRRTINNRTEFLIKWKGWGTKHNTWEPEENILGRTLLENFEKREKKRQLLLEKKRSKQQSKETDEDNETISSKSTNQSFDSSNASDESILSNKSSSLIIRKATSHPANNFMNESSISDTTTETECEKSTDDATNNEFSEDNEQKVNDEEINKNILDLCHRNVSCLDHVKMKENVDDERLMMNLEELSNSSINSNEDENSMDEKEESINRSQSDQSKKENLDDSEKGNNENQSTEVMEKNEEFFNNYSKNNRHQLKRSFTPDTIVLTDVTYKGLTIRIKESLL
ncbi:hypothetical protein SNEBB_003216 [Seison nebaliae]|nr:hypothetical protein SNEBB_003216 [Seison nebaliae]